MYYFSVTHPDCPEATRRTLDFSLGGLEEVAKECAKLNIEFHLLQDMTKSMADRVLDFVKESKVGCVVTDFSPLRHHRYCKIAIYNYFIEIDPLQYLFLPLHQNSTIYVLI